jgi:5-methyltetrahydropteroyltriglutamate--homocysteine methyltransferase
MRPPFRAEHVGSFPRPEALIEARADFAAGRIARQELRQAETDAVRAVVALQERVGIGAVTDGEFRKSDWRDFAFEHISGYSADRKPGPFKFKLYDGTVVDTRGIPAIEDRLRRRDPISADDFSLLKPMTAAPIKATLPTPSSLGGSEIRNPQLYPSLRAVLADVAAVLREEIADLSARGCTYLQLDECRWRCSAIPTTSTSSAITAPTPRF